MWLIRPSQERPGNPEVLLAVSDVRTSLILREIRKGIEVASERDGLQLDSISGLQFQLPLAEAFDPVTLPEPLEPSLRLAA